MNSIITLRHDALPALRQDVLPVASAFVRKGSFVGTGKGCLYIVLTSVWHISDAKLPKPARRVNELTTNFSALLCFCIATLKKRRIEGPHTSYSELNPGLKG